MNRQEGEGTASSFLFFKQYSGWVSKEVSVLVQILLKLEYILLKYLRNKTFRGT